MSPEEFTMVMAELKDIKNSQLIMVSDIATLKAKVHTPLDCPMRTDIDSLKTFRDKEKGVLWVIGVVAGTFAAAIIKVGELIFIKK